MNSFIREIKVDKLKKNGKRLNFLKLTSVICFLLDLITFMVLESIELYFQNFSENISLLICYISKIGTFLLLGVFIMIAIFYQKNKILLMSAIIYFILGLGLFFYLIMQEMTLNKDMKPITDSKPEIYYEVFLKIIITLNIIGGFFRILAVILMFIYVRISKKIVKITQEINENYYDKNNESSIVQNLNTSKISQFSKLKTNFNSIIEKSYATINKDKQFSSTFSEGKALKDTFIKRTNFLTVSNRGNTKTDNQQTNKISCNKCSHSDLSIAIVNETNKNSNNFPENKYNYTNGNASNSNNQIMYAPHLSSGTFSNDLDREKNNYLESLYETPKKMSFV